MPNQVVKGFLCKGFVLTVRLGSLRVSFKQRDADGNVERSVDKLRMFSGA